jgi:hypothetical protein
MYGQHRVESQDYVSADGDDEIIVEDDKASSFGFGLYGRTGIDFQYKEGQHLGLGVRYMNAEMDFDDTVGKLDISGPQFVLTYTQML